MRNLIMTSERTYQLRFDTSDFYIDTTHRNCTLKVQGGKPGELLDVNLISSNVYNNSHPKTWTDYSTKYPSMCTFDSNGECILHDACVTHACDLTVVIGISYRGKSYQVSLRIYTIS